MRLLVVFIGILFVAALFAVIERLWPAIRGQRKWRRPGMGTDITYLLYAPTVGRIFSGLLVGASVLALAAVFSISLTFEDLRNANVRDTWVSRQPVGLQMLAFLLIADFLGYWQHRWFHRVPRLWRFHSIHHSSTQVDWLSSVRVHPVNDVIGNIILAAPLLLLGFSPGTLGAYVPLLTLYAIMLHANVGWSFGPLRYVVSSPAFHRWHHTCEDEGLDKNFAGLFPAMDLVFGSFYMPKDRQPQEFGVKGESVPLGFFQQLAYPFRKQRPSTAPPSTP